MTGYLRNKYNPVELTIFYTMFTGFILFCISTLAGLDYLYNFISPITTFMAVLLMVTSIANAGRHWMSGFYYLFGIFFWVVSDVLVIVYTYRGVGSQYFTAISDIFYLMTNYIFAVAMFIYTFEETGREKRTFFIVGTVTSLILIVLLFAELITRGGGLISYSSTYGVSGFAYYIGCALNVAALIIHIIMRGFKERKRAFYILIIGILLYNILDFRYGYLITASKEAEMPVLDIFYLLSIILIAISYKDSTNLTEVVKRDSADHSADMAEKNVDE